MYWFLDDAARLAHERAAIDELLASADWLAGVAWSLDGGGIAVDADIVACGSDYRVTMRYPTMFPATPPTVRPRDPSEPRWSSHQYVNGELCLEFGADTWLPTFTGAQLLESAHRLFEIENPRADGELERTTAPSRHQVTLGQELRSQPFRFVTTAHLRGYAETLPAGISDATLLYNLWQEKSYTLIVTNIRSGDVVWNDTYVPTQFAKTGLERRACVVRLAQWQAAWRPRTLDELLAYVDDAQRESLRARIAELPADYLLVIDKTNALHLIDLPTDKWAADEIPEIRAREDLAAARTEASDLNSKSVGIVGLGSAGSKIAISLARSGIRNFVLVDDDIFVPENIVRNELDWRNVGEHKVDAITSRLHLIAADVTVDVRRIRLAGQESNATSAGALERLANSDLIIDATANPDVFNVLGSVAQRTKRTLVWLEVFGGGFGGLVARYRPDIDPEPAYMRHGLNAYYESTPDPPHAALGYGELDVEGVIHLATDAEVGIIAEHAARFALDTLAQAEPSAFPSAMYLIGLRRAWIFDAPFDTRPIDLSNVTVPEPAPENVEERAAGMAFVRALLDAMQ